MYRGQAGLTGTEGAAGSEHHLVIPGRRLGLGGHQIVSTVSLIRDQMAGAQDTGWMLQWRIVRTVSLNQDDDLDSEDTGS